VSTLFPDQLPQQLISKAISLEVIGIKKIAWHYENITLVIETLTDNEYAILGGDVYSLVKKEINVTGDTWYLDKNGSESWREYVAESKTKALAYVDRYYQRNGSNFLYSVSFTNKLVIRI
jgi:hypothetical protein